MTYLVKSRHENMRKTRKRYSLLLLLTCLVCVISLWTSLRSLWITDSNPLDTRSNREILNEDISKIAADIIAAEKIFNATDIKTLETVKFHHVSRIPAAQLPWQPKNNSVANVLEIPPAQFPWQLKNNSVANDTMLQVTTRKPKPITRKLGIDLMRTLYRNTRKLADTSGHHSNFFSNVSSILATPWRHDTYNAKLFRFIYENVTRMNAYDDTMLTQRNKGKRIYGTINIPKESLLPKAPYKSCSVVGSSRVLLGLKCGTLIDENDFVFRSTLSSIAGPAEDVGKKTNMTTLNSSILKRFAIRTPDDTSLTMVKANKNHYQKNSAFWKQLGLKSLPTTGFYLLNCALDLCSDVHVFGFWPFTTYLDGRSIPAHYYDNIKQLGSHDAAYELRLILTMHKLGMLKFHMDDCTT